MTYCYPEPFVKNSLTLAASISYIHIKLFVMAKVYEPLVITGTIGNACFYKMDGKYYVRMKSSLTRKRVLKDASFRRTREHAATLGVASKIASRVYRLITGEHKKHALYREITGKAIYLLREGKDKEAAFQSLSREYLNRKPLPEPTITCTKNVTQDNRGYLDMPELPVPKLKKAYPGLLAGRPTRASTEDEFLRLLRRGKRKCVYLARDQSVSKKTE